MPRRNRCAISGGRRKYGLVDHGGSNPNRSFVSETTELLRTSLVAQDLRPMPRDLLCDGRGGERVDACLLESRSSTLAPSPKPGRPSPKARRARARREQERTAGGIIMSQPFAALKGDVLVITTDVSVTGNPLEQMHPDDAAEHVAVLPKPGAPIADFLVVIEKQPGWTLLTQPPYGTVLEVQVA